MPSGIMVSKGTIRKMALVEQQQTSGESGNQSTAR